MSDKPPSIYLAYSHADSEVARLLDEHLRAAELSVWIDERHLRPGDPIWDGMGRGLRDASYVLYLHSESSATSQPTSFEAGYALFDPATVLVPVRIDDTAVRSPFDAIRYVDLRDFESGAEELVRFFQDELEGQPARGADNLRFASARTLRRVAGRCFATTDELRDFLEANGWADVELTEGRVHDELLRALHALGEHGRRLFGKRLTSRWPSAVDEAIRDVTG